MAYELSRKGCQLLEVVSAIKAGVSKDDFLLEVESPILLEVPTEGALPVEFGGEEEPVEDPLATVKVRVDAVAGLRRTRNMETAMVYLLQPAEAGKPCLIGRGESCDVMLENEGVSRRHAEIHEGGGNFFLVDLASHNGSFVDKERVDPNERIGLEDRCNIWLGSFRGVFLAPDNFYDLVAMLAGRREPA